MLEDTRILASRDPRNPNDSQCKLHSSQEEDDDEVGVVHHHVQYSSVGPELNARFNRWISMPRACACAYADLHAEQISCFHGFAALLMLTQGHNCKCI